MRKIHTFWAAVTGLLVLAGLALCAVGLRNGTLLVKTQEDPGRVVTAFFEELTAGEWDAAYGRLSNYRSLGLENAPRSGESALLLAALRDSYRCSLLEPAEQRGDTAVQRIRLRFLDLDALETGIAAGEAADLAGALSVPEAFTAQADYAVALTFDGAEWRIELDPALLDAVQGRAPGEGAA